MSGLGLASILGIVFVTLKLTHLIVWPWIWVLSPFWIGLVAFLLLVFAASFSQD